jgi:glycosyltransferase involved in cell wall biosynthesis
MGLLEQVDRDPVPFFKGVRLALDNGSLPPGAFCVDLLGSGAQEARYRSVLAELRLEEVVRIQPPVPYRQALDRMASTDILLLFQGPSCDAQIPAKAYEYMRIGKPVFALTTPQGATGRLIAANGAGQVVPCGDPEAIARALAEWVAALRAGKALPAATRASAEAFSRQNQAMTLAQRFRELLD